jgi:putative membrane protein
MAVLVFAPLDFHPALAFADFLFAFFVVSAAANHIGALKRVVVGRRRQEKNVRQSLLVSFHDEGVDSTRGRTGVLIYASVFERAIRIHADLGIEGKIGESAWNEILRGAGTPSPGEMGETLVRVIEAAGAVLAKSFPPSAENPDEIPNRPRVVKG